MSKRRNPAARNLRDPMFGQRVVRSRKLYNRKGSEDPMTDINETDIVIQKTMKAGEQRARRRPLLEQWFVDGQITQEMHDAGLRFEHDFEGSQMRDRYGTYMVERVSGGAQQKENYVVSVLHARKRINSVLEALGDIGSSVLWDCLGNQLSLREHATRQQCNGKPINTHQAKGRLIAALGMLSRHYGFN